jgi:hypothetical protein
MGRQVTVTLICDVCKKPADEKTSVPGQLAASRRRFSLHLHKGCLESLTSSAEPVARRRRRGRPRGSTTKRKAS